MRMKHPQVLVQFLRVLEVRMNITQKLGKVPYPQMKIGPKLGPVVDGSNFLKSVKKNGRISPESLAPSSSSVVPVFPEKIGSKGFIFARRKEPAFILMASDFAFKVPAELESALRLNTVQYYITKRPWLDLYGINVRPVAPVGSTSRKVHVDPALLHRTLPDELLYEVFARMSPYDLGRAACVCRKWRYTIRNPVFWRIACLKAWQLSGVVENYKILQAKYDTSWRKMWLLRPRVRTDGLYVSRNTYIRTGIAEWKITNPVHLVCYYRYMRFFPSGRFLYKNSSQKLKDVAKFMNFRSSKADSVFSGHYTFSDDKVEAAVLYPGMRPTVLRIRLRLRGTTVGANNRMDLLSLVTSGVNDNEVCGPDEDILGVVEGWQDDETHNPDVPAVSHKRGLTPFVFVPFEEVETSFLNLPVEKMDYFVPG